MIRRFHRAELRGAFSQVSWEPAGRVRDVVGTVIEAHMPESKLGSIVDIEVPGGPLVLAEVVGFRDQRTLLLPLRGIQGISTGCVVRHRDVWDKVIVGPHLLGQVVDPMLNRLDSVDLPEVGLQAAMPIDREAPNPMLRQRIHKTLGLGVRAIDGLLTFGEGQRLGIMAGSGVGKSVLMGMIARGSAAEINVIALIGERGREVREFIEKDLGESGLARSVVVCVTSDQSPLMRIRGAKVATAIAEYFSQQGKKVLLMMDSLTRVAMAQREIGLAVGEPPTTKGYPPSVFSLLPRLLERCGPQSVGQGSISGLYTVLVDGDDFNDPMPDAARAILDGHINLSRELAARGHFPAIDVTTSTSRVMNDIVSDEHWSVACRLRALLGVHKENYDYLQIGSYAAGSNQLMDEAIALMPAIESFLQQDMRELVPFEQSLSIMTEILAAAKQSPTLRTEPTLQAL